MMKTQKLAAILAALCLLLAGCSTAEVSAPPADPPPVQNDLTQMSGTMVYSYLFAMLTTPEDYLGQSFRLRGTYDYWMADEFTDQDRHFVVIADATLCCALGIEFVLLAQDAAYPEPGAEIEIMGIYASYEEDGMEYGRLEKATLMEVELGPPDSQGPGVAILDEDDV